MAIGTVYQLEHKQSLFNEPMQNTYHFVGLTGDADAEKLVELFIDQIAPAVWNVQTNETAERGVRAYALFDLGDFAEETIIVPTYGSVTSATLPSTVAFNISLKTVNRGIGPGSKRYSAIPSDAQDNNYINNVNYITGIQELMTALAAPLVDGAIDTFNCVIVKRVFYEATEDRKAGYYMPATEIEQEIATVNRCSVNLKLSHQNTRGNGR